MEEPDDPIGGMILGSWRRTDAEAADVDLHGSLTMLGKIRRGTTTRGLEQGLPGESSICSQMRARLPGTRVEIHEKQGFGGFRSQPLQMDIGPIVIDVVDAQKPASSASATVSFPVPVWSEGWQSAISSATG